MSANYMGYKRTSGDASAGAWPLGTWKMWVSSGDWENGFFDRLKLFWIDIMKLVVKIALFRFQAEKMLKIGRVRVRASACVRKWYLYNISA